MPLDEECEACQGSGDCLSCGGTGFEDEAISGMKCPDCDGTGACPECDGSGFGSEPEDA